MGNTLQSAMLMRTCLRMLSAAKPHAYAAAASLQAIVFDCDGTLLDTMTLHWQSWKEACAHFELPITLPWWLAQAGKPADEILRLLCAMDVRRDGIRDPHLHPPDASGALGLPVAEMANLGALGCIFSEDALNSAQIHLFNASPFATFLFMQQSKF